MSDDPEYKRTKTKRRYTESNKLARGKTSNTEKLSETELTISSNLFEDLAKLIDPETSSLEMIFAVTVKILKTCTKSSWVEFALLEGGKLRVCNSIQHVRILDVDSTSSLMGYVACHQNPILLTNPHTNTFFSKFPIQMQAFSLLTGTTVKPNSVACVPIFVRYI